MGFLLAVSRIYLPRSIRKSRLEELFKATAGAFQQQTPQFNGCSLEQCLMQYALFTAENARKSINRGNAGEVKQRLYANARQIGGILRAELKVKTLKQVMQACAVLYKALGIEFHGDLKGQIRIPACFFSSFYSGEVCRIISGLDEGLVAGLSGGLRLEFFQRITEGNTCCRARLLKGGSPL